jgi:hypothetical protein
MMRWQIKVDIADRRLSRPASFLAVYAVAGLIVITQTLLGEDDHDDDDGEAPPFLLKSEHMTRGGRKTPETSLAWR